MWMKHNRHQRLFYFGKFGVFLHMILLKNYFTYTCGMLAILISSLIFKDGLLKGIFGDEAIEAVVFLLESIISLYFLFKLYPKILFKYVMITSTHMMKNSHNIVKVIEKQKQK